MIGTMLHNIMVSMTTKTTHMEEKREREHKLSLIAYIGAINNRLTTAANGNLITKPLAATAG